MQIMQIMQMHCLARRIGASCIKQSPRSVADIYPNQHVIGASQSEVLDPARGANLTNQGPGCSAGTNGWQEIVSAVKIKGGRLILFWNYGRDS